MRNAREFFLKALIVVMALVALWLLLDMASRDAVFGASAFRWVDVIIASALLATAMHDELAEVV